MNPISSLLNKISEVGLLDTVQKAPTYQVTTMLATSKIVLFSGARVIIKVLGHKYQWLAGGYDLEIGHFSQRLAWWLPGR